MRTTIFAVAMVMMMGCGYEPMIDMIVAQTPPSGLPEYGQEIKTSTATGVVVSATADGRVTRSSETPEMFNLYRLQVDSQEVFLEGALVSWSNGSGVVIKSTRLQLYGIRGSL